MKTNSDASVAPHVVSWLHGKRSRKYRWPSKEAKVWVTSFVARACAFVQTRALVMIGSIVRPIATVNDVDLLYVYNAEPLSFRHHPLDVDIRAFSDSEVSKRFREKHDLIIWALEFGELLCERDGFWSELRRSLEERPALPSPQTALDRAERAERRFIELKDLGDIDAATEQLVSTLTHRAWFHLLSAGVLPASRAELSEQLRSIGQQTLAVELERAIRARRFGRPTSSIKGATS